MKALRLPFAAALACALSLSPVFAAPAITATQDDATSTATRKAVGETITYTTTISNTAPVIVGSTANDATGVQLTNPKPTNTTDIGSVSISPIAFDDIYPQTVIANIGINSANIPYSIFSNDYLGTPGVTTIASYDTSTTAVGVGGVKGTVSMVTSGANLGQFTYQPPPGFVGTDTFTYTLTNPIGSSVGTVTITVAGPVVWFANPSAAAGGTGTLAAPFQTLAAANAVAASGHRIFLFAGNYTGGITLLNGVLLYGQGVSGASFDAVLLALTPGSGTVARPTINGSDPVITTSAAATNAINLTAGASNTIAGLTIGNKTGSGIASGANFGTLTISDLTINGSGQALALLSGTVNATFDALSSTSSAGNAIFLNGINGNLIANAGAISNAGSEDIVVSGGNASITYAGTITNTASRSLNISGHTGGTILFSGAITDTGTGISLTTNTGTTINFTGGLNLSTGASPAFTATGGGTVSATQNNTTIVNTLTTSTGTALNVSNTTIGASGLTFRSISASGAANGILLNSTGSLAGLTVTGNAGNCTTASPTCTGGRIQNTTGADGSSNGVGVYLNNTRLVSLTRMRIDNHANFAVFGTSVQGININSCLLDGANGTSAAADEATISLRELTGTTGAGTASSITNSFIGGGREFLILVQNFNPSTTLDRITISNNTIGDLDGAGAGFGLHQTDGDDAIQLQNAAPQSAGQNSTFNATVTNNVVNVGRGDIVNFNVGNGGTMNANLVLRNNTMHNTHPQVLSGGGGLTITAGGTTSHNVVFDIACNSIRGSKGFGVLVAKAGTGSSGIVNTTLFNNRIGADGVVNSGSAEAAGINIDTRGGGTHNVLLRNNQVHNWGANGAFQIFNNQGNATMNVTAQGNLSNNPDAEALAGFYAESGALNGDASILNLLIGGAGANENNFIEGDFFDGNDVLLSRINCSGGCNGTQLNLSRGVSGASNIQQIITDNNTDPVTAASAGTITFVNTFPTLPPALDTSCAPPLLLGAPTVLDDSPIVACASMPVPVTAEVAAAIDTPREQRVSASAVAANDALPSAELSQAQLDAGVSSAIALWERAGITPHQLERLRALRFEVASLHPQRLGETDGSVIRVDADAGGNGWYAESSATESTVPLGRVHLITALLHEMGHVLGLSDTYAPGDRHDLMYGFLTTGERRAPAKDQAVGVVPNEASGAHFLAAPVNIGTLPPGKSVKIVYSVTVGPITGNPQSVSSQGTVSGGNFGSVQTDDLQLPGGAADPTVTLLAIPPAITSGNATTFTVGTAGTFSVTANGAPPPAFSATGTLPSGVTLSTAGVLSGTPAAGTGGTYPITITANNGIAPNATQSFTLTVNQPPAITSASNVTFTRGTFGTFTVVATGFPKPALTQPSTLPAGVTFVDNANGTATLSGTPGANTGGPYSFTITAANGVGSNATQSFTLSIVTTASNYMAQFGLTGPNAAFNFDNEGDGIPNGLEYALSLDPTAANLTGLPVVILKDYSGTKYLSITFTRSAIATDLTYIVQGSSDLTNWSALGTSTAGGAMSGAGFVSETPSGNLFNVEVRDTVPFNPNSATPRFLRLKVTSP